MNKITILIISIITIGTLVSTGCFEYINSNSGKTIYVSHPTKINYTIEYGYQVNFTGSGEFNIVYDCDIPEILIGTVKIPNLLHNEDYSEIKLANNTIIRWNISDEGKNYYELGIKAIIETESYIVNDLNGIEAYTIKELKTNFKDTINQYCQIQSNGTINFIDPKNDQIKTIADNIKNKAKSNNSFIIAKELFIWLKQNTKYKTHLENDNIQTAIATLQKKTGDCDDLSFLYISLCRSLKIPARFIRGYIVEKNNEQISITPHAWVEVFVGSNLGNSGWIPVECAGDSSITTEINQNFGIEDVSHLRLFEDNGSNESLNASISGIVMYYDENLNVEMHPFGEIIQYKVLDSKELCINKDNLRSYI